MAASTIHCIFTGCQGPIDEGQKIPKTVFKLDTFLKKAVSKIEVDRRSNHCILRVFSDTSTRFNANHRSP